MTLIDRTLTAAKRWFESLLLHLTGRYYHPTLPLTTLMGAFFGALMIVDGTALLGVVLAPALPMLTILGSWQANRRWSA